MALAHAILSALTECPCSGYDLTKQFDGSLGFFWKASYQQKNGWNQKGIWLIPGFFTSLAIQFARTRVTFSFKVFLPLVVNKNLAVLTKVKYISLFCHSPDRINTVVKSKNSTIEV